jgi:hypothetical protein
VKKLRGFTNWLENGSELKFRRLSHVNIRGIGGGGLVSSGRSFFLENLLPPSFSGVQRRNYADSLLGLRTEAISSSGIFRILTYGVRAEGIWLPVFGVSC